MRAFYINVTFVVLAVWGYISVAAQEDDRYQYPTLLAKSYFGLDIGSINYPFSNSHLAQGYSAESVHIPHLALRFTLYGYRFTKNLSARITYMRPVDWVQYLDVNGDHSYHSVFMNIGGLTLNGRLPLGKRVALFGEAGLGIITRSGFQINGTQVLEDATYPALLLGAGLEYHLNDKWHLILSAPYTPPSAERHMPYMNALLGGFRYNLQPLSQEKVERNRKAGYRFPAQLLQFGYTTNTLGYNVNLVSDKMRIFWGGGWVEVKNGVSVVYQRNVFHTRKVFALDVGTAFSRFTSRRKQESFVTLSAFPVLRFTVVRARPADFYFFYSVAGPTYISRSYVDEQRTGTSFTFRDYMGIGLFSGKKRTFNTEINIGHFSNGNIFTQNQGFKVPLSFNLGYTFK